MWECVCEDSLETAGQNVQCFTELLRVSSKDRESKGIMTRLAPFTKDSPQRKRRQDYSTTSALGCQGVNAASCPWGFSALATAPSVRPLDLHLSLSVPGAGTRALSTCKTSYLYGPNPHLHVSMYQKRVEFWSSCLRIQSSCKLHHLLGHLTETKNYGARQWCP